MIAAGRHPFETPLIIFVDDSLRARSFALFFTVCAPRFWSVTGNGGAQHDDIQHTRREHAAYFREDHQSEDLRTPLLSWEQKRGCVRLEGLRRASALLGLSRAVYMAKRTAAPRHVSPWPLLSTSFHTAMKTYHETGALVSRVQHIRSTRI